MAPWFDKECKSKKLHLSKLGKILKKNPGNPEARLELKQQKKHLKRLIATKKRSHKQNMLHKMTNMRSETKPKAFWNMLKKISPKVKVDSKNIPAHNFSQYFKKLLNTRKTLDIPPDEEKVGELDYSISLDELKASSILKPGKALGIDNIGNEMIIGLVEGYPSIILKLFNLILQTCGVIPDWLVGAIVPIFKKGSKAEPSNYRGITLLCLGKLFITKTFYYKLK